MKYGTKPSDSENRTRRSIARLLSLADMVERSSFQFFLIRVFLLWLLRPTEWRVRSLVFELAEDAGLQELPEIFDVFHTADSGYLEHNSADEALDMALRLRALAALMAWLHGLDATACHIGDVLFWSNYWRHMRWLEQAFQAHALRMTRCDQATFERPEVRSAQAIAVGGAAARDRLRQRSRLCATVDAC